MRDPVYKIKKKEDEEPCVTTPLSKNLKQTAILSLHRPFFWHTSKADWRDLALHFRGERFWRTRPGLAGVFIHLTCEDREMETKKVLQLELMLGMVWHLPGPVPSSLTSHVLDCDIATLERLGSGDRQYNDVPVIHHKQRYYDGCSREDTGSSRAVRKSGSAYANTRSHLIRTPQERYRRRWESY